MRPEWPALLVGLALLFPLEAGLDAYPGEEATVLVTLPPAQLLPVLACGHGGTLADLLEIRSTNYLLRGLEPGQRMSPDELERFYYAICALDPYDPESVVRGSVYLATMADRPDAAMTLLEAAAARIPREHPRRWTLLWEMVAVHITALAYRGDREEHLRRSGELLLEIAELPGVTNPDAYAGLGRRLATRGLTPLESLRREEGYWEDRTHVGEEAVRARARERLQEVRCGIRRERLERARGQFEAQVGRLPRHLSELRLELDDPLGIGFYLCDGRVVAPGYQAHQLERALVPRLQGWLQRHPGATPSLEDLGVSGVPSYLRVVLSADDVHVEVHLPPGVEPGGVLPDSP